MLLLKRVPPDWNDSYIISLCNGKEIWHERDDYTGLKLTEDVKVTECVIEKYIKDQIKLDGM